jgi:hypothetical protein
MRGKGKADQAQHRTGQEVLDELADEERKEMVQCLSSPILPRIE